MKLEKFATLTRKARSFVRLLIYRKWPCRSRILRFFRDNFLQDSRHLASMIGKAECLLAVSEDKNVTFWNNLLLDSYP